MKAVIKLFFILFVTGLLAIADFLSPNTILAASTPSLTFVSKILPDAGDVELAGGYAFTSYSGGIAILDVSNPTYPLLTTNYKPDGCRYGYLSIQNNLLYSTQVSDLRYDCSRRGIHLYNSLHIIDVTNIFIPLEIGWTAIGGVGGGTGTEQSENVNFYTNANGGLVVIDTSNPSRPEIINTFFGGIADFRDVKIVGDVAYLADLNGKLWVVDVQDLNNIRPISNHTQVPGALAIDIEGSYAYIAAGQEGFFIVDIRNPANPVVVGNINWKNEVPTNNATLDVDVENGFAFLSNSQRGVVVVDVSDSVVPMEVTRLGLNGFAAKLEVSGEHVYVADLYQGLNILRFETSETGTLLNVPLFKQTDPAWGGLTYASADSNPLTCGTTIAQCGCAISSIAMILKYHGVEKDPEGNPTTPETVNRYFKKDEVCGNSGCASLGYAFGATKWFAASLYSKRSNDFFGSQKIVFTGKDFFDMENVSHSIVDQKPVVIRVSGREHWVVTKGVVPNTLAINDPGFDRLVLSDSAYENTALASRYYEKTSSDFSSFEITVKYPTQALVTDKQGRRTGFVLATNEIVKEIPHSYYDFEGDYSDPTGSGSVSLNKSGVYTVLILTPEQNTFKVEFVGEKFSDYGFAVHASTKNANTDFNLFENSLSENGGAEYVFDYNPVAVNENSIFDMKIDIDIWPHVKKNMVLTKSSTPIRVGILSSSNFNAPGEIDQSTLTFGSTGNEKSLISCLDYYPDLNKDGIEDLYCLFSTPLSFFKKGDKVGFLRGNTYSGVNFTSLDKILILN